MNSIKCWKLAYGICYKMKTWFSSSLSRIFDLLPHSCSTKAENSSFLFPKSHYIHISDFLLTENFFISLKIWFFFFWFRAILFREIPHLSILHGIAHTQNMNMKMYFFQKMTGKQKVKWSFQWIFRKLLPFRYFYDHFYTWQLITDIMILTLTGRGFLQNSYNYFFQSW